MAGVAGGDAGCDDARGEGDPSAGAEELVIIYNLTFYLFNGKLHILVFNLI